MREDAMVVKEHKWEEGNYADNSTKRAWVKQDVDPAASVLSETQLFHPYKPTCTLTYCFRFSLPCKGKEVCLYPMYDSYMTS